MQVYYSSDDDNFIETTRFRTATDLINNRHELIHNKFIELIRRRTNRKDISTKKEYINKHTSLITSNDIETACSICLSALNTNTCRQIKKCKHIFHKDCIDIWLLKHFNCPLCRVKI